MSVFECFGDLLRHTHRLFRIHWKAKAFGHCFGALPQPCGHVRVSLAESRLEDRCQPRMVDRSRLHQALQLDKCLALQLVLGLRQHQDRLRAVGGLCPSVWYRSLAPATGRSLVRRNSPPDQTFVDAPGFGSLGRLDACQCSEGCNDPTWQHRLAGRCGCNAQKVSGQAAERALHRASILS